LAQALARESSKGPILSFEAPPSTSPPARSLDPDLARVVDAWPALPEPIRRVIRAAVEAALMGGVESEHLIWH
jgi:hypothetical protein